jgi:ABC-type transport system involved in multi-copper enzyme maturation permease subunit
MRSLLPALQNLPPSAWAVATALLAVTLAILLRPMWGRLLGPVFVWESERLARRGNTFILRVVFIGALLAALYSAWPTVEVLPASLEAQDSLSLVVMRRFSREFSNAFLVALSAVLLLVTPLYVGGAISDEKEKRSLDFLLVTQLRNRDIVLGKLGSRVVALLTVALASLPVLAVTLLFGGVDLAGLLAGVAATAVSVVSLGSFALLCSVLMRRTWAAVGLAYAGAALAGLTLYLAGFGLLASPVSFHWALAVELERAQTQGVITVITGVMLLLYLTVHIVLVLVCVLLAEALLRRLADRSVFAAVATPAPRAVPPTADPPKRRVYRTRAAIPPVGDRPVLWKERYLGRTIAGTVLHNTASLAFLVLAVVLTVFVVVHPPDLAYLGDGLRGLFVLAGVMLTCGLGLRLAGAFSREREQQTLESLLTIPDARRTILRAKAFGAVLRVRRYIAGLLFVAAALVYAGGADLVPCLVALLMVAAHSACAASFALYLSLACRSTVRAYMTLIVTVLVLLAGSAAVGELGTSRAYGTPTDGDWALDVYVQAVNPVAMWSQLLEPTGTESPAAGRVMRDSMAVAAGLPLYLLAAYAFWLLAARRLRREAERG